jgi:hypothetical protein
VNHFQEPAGYRSNAAIGQIINNIYKSAKQKKLIKYYLSYLTEFFKQNNEMPILGHLKILLNEVHKSNQWAKLPWILYALFIEIPVRSRLQRRFEKRYMEGKIR